MAPNTTKATRIIFAILAIAFFAAPIAARTLGITAEAFENRRFADPPRLSQGWDGFQQTTQFLTDRMPLRAQAVRANTRIWTDVFGATPRYAGAPALAADGALPFGGSAEGGEQPAEAPTAEQTAAQNAAQVLRGSDGWLFLQGEQDRSCAPAIPISDALERWAALVALVRRSGRRAIAIVPPDKASVYPEHLPDGFPNADCAAVGKQALWALLERSARRTGVLPLRAALLREKRRGGDTLYLRKDSHWNHVGSLSLVRAALAAVGGPVRIAAGEVVDVGEGPYTGDLTGLLGDPESDTTPQRTVTRAPDAPKVPGRTLLVKDSYGEAPSGQLAPYFEDLRTILWVGTPPARLAREIALADTVIFETVERELVLRAGPEGLVDPLLVALRGRLAGP
jgi:alginate O-acetyltransferase complex protein AlgJ